MAARWFLGFYRSPRDDGNAGKDGTGLAAGFVVVTQLWDSGGRLGIHGIPFQKRVILLAFSQRVTTAMPLGM